MQQERTTAAPSARAAVVRARAQITGTVQGVGYRYFVLRAARDLGLAGWVRNLSTGAVEVEVEGPPTVVNGFLELLRRGPSAAVVREVRVDWTAPLGERGFAIR